MKQTDPQYKLRLPQELKDKIEAAASTSGRSMNAEIVVRLQGSFEGKHVHVSVGEGVGATDANVADSLRNLEARLEKQETTISTLTGLAHALAVLGAPKDVGGLDVAAMFLKHIKDKGDPDNSWDEIIATVSRELAKTKKPSERVRRPNSPNGSK